MQTVSRENISQWIRENEQGLWPSLARERSQARTVRQQRGAGKARPKGLKQHTVWQRAAQEQVRQDRALWGAGAAQSVPWGAGAARPKGLEQHTVRQSAAQERTRQNGVPWGAGAARPKTPWYQRTPRAWFRPLFAALLLVRQQRAAVGWAGHRRGESASGFAAAGSRRGEATGRSGFAAARCSGGAGDD